MNKENNSHFSKRYAALCFVFLIILIHKSNLHNPQNQQLKIGRSDESNQNQTIEEKDPSSPHAVVKEVLAFREREEDLKAVLKVQSLRRI